MAPFIQAQRRNVRSPSPGNQQRRASAALGNLRSVYTSFPELGPCPSRTITTLAIRRCSAPKLGQFLQLESFLDELKEEESRRPAGTTIQPEANEPTYIYSKARNVQELSDDDDDYHGDGKQLAIYDDYTEAHISRTDSQTAIDTDQASADGSAPLSEPTTPSTSPDLELAELFNSQLSAELRSVKEPVALETQIPAYSAPTPLFVPFNPYSGGFHPYNAYELPGLQYRSDLVNHVVAQYNMSLSAHNPWKINLPWDLTGQYKCTPTYAQQRVGVSSINNRLAIEPLYRVDKFTQVQLVKAQLHVADLDVAQPNTPSVTPALHVFVDMSNIVIGFYDHIKQNRGIGRKDQVQGGPFFFDALAMVLERGRPCAKKIIVGSTGPGRAKEDYMTDAEAAGYTAHILQRVKGGKTKTYYNKPPSPSSSNPNAHREQAVDEILQLHMLESVADTPPAFVAATGERLGPGTIVLATGDGAATDFSEGFFAQAMRALRAGWYVEVVGFSRNMSKVWNEHRIPEEWRCRFRLIELDPFAEEMIESFRD